MMELQVLSNTALLRYNYRLRRRPNRLARLISAVDF